VTETSARRWIAAAAVVAIVLRAAFALGYWVGKPLTHDEREYLALARGLTEGRGFAYDPAEDVGTSARFGRAPGYPVFLASIGAGLERYESAPTRVKLAQACVGGITVFLIGLLTLRASGAKAAVTAAALAAVYPPLVWMPSYVFSETIYSAFALLAVLVLQRAVDLPSTPSTFRRKSMAIAIAAGLLAGLGILTRPALLFFMPLAAVWLLAAGWRHVAIAFLTATLLTIAPWTIRNARVHGRFVLVASEGGVTFWTGNHPQAIGEGDLAANPDLKAAELAFRRAHPGLTAEELEPLYYREALQWIGANPGRWMVLLAKKIFYTAVPLGPSYTLHSTRYWAASVVSYLLILPLAIVGIGRLWRAERRPTALLLLGASAVLASVIFFPQERFRIPVIDPVLIIAAAVTIATTRWRGAQA
jgi:4-amino-4-deoxy-L-arabinose transferase-like glycosyltransferase